MSSVIYLETKLTERGLQRALTEGFTALIEVAARGGHLSFRAARNEDALRAVVAEGRQLLRQLELYTEALASLEPRGDADSDQAAAGSRPIQMLLPNPAVRPLRAGGQNTRLSLAIASEDRDRGSAGGPQVVHPGHRELLARKWVTRVCRATAQLTTACSDSPSDTASLAARARGVMEAACNALIQLRRMRMR